MARGMLPGFLGTVTREDCDEHGRMLEVACMGRISDGISHFWLPLQTGPRPAGVGGAALEYRLVFHTWPRLSDVIEVRSALSSLSNKVLSLTHYVFDVATGELTLWVTSQNPHVHRLLMCAFVLGIPEHKVRVIAPDVGGGFGSKIFLYNEEVVCSWASRQLKRPIRSSKLCRRSLKTHLLFGS